MSPRAFFLGILGFGIVCWIGPTGAQNEIAPEQLDRPPVAAPTTKIQTGAIPVVLSDSQEADYFVSGMIRGLLVGSGVKGIALVVVKDDSVTFQRNAGSVAPDTRFAAGALTDVFGAVAAMQQVERGRLALDADIAKPLGETGTRGMNLGQVLAFQSGDPALAIRAVEKTAGAAWPEYAMKNIAQPLGMNATMCGDGTLQTTLADMGHLTIALVNGGVFQNGRALMPASVELMESTHVTLHPALPGWAYGFAETPRNGWRVLQHDAVNGAFASRLVIVPEAKLGYFIVAEGPTNAQFWRALDDGLFDRLLPPHAASSAASASGPAPTQTDAERVAGRYEFVRTPASDAASLKQGPRLNVRAGPGAELNLTGAETGTLAPRPGGYWASADGNVNAVALNGDLVLSTGRYGPLAFYKRPELYSFLALLAALAAGGFVAYERRRTPQARFPSDPVLGLASASIVFLLVSAFVWLFAPGA
ncbi:MAG TPA: serine hydrolase domain-containing protein [Micropepsaceae bacterium]|nr:serine hydrolase domain-containing protein [Micropepsaceae bacterium]